MAVTTSTRSGRGWAYTGVTAGGLVSIAANVAHSFIPPHGAPVAWTPETGAVAGAVVWPVFLFIAVEILARISWPQGTVWHVVRWAGLLPVAAVAALVSYRHLSGLLAHYGEEPIVYLLGPLAADGLMVMATGALLATSRRRTTPPTNSAARRDNAPATPEPTTDRPSDNEITAVPSIDPGPATPNSPPSATGANPTGPAPVPQVVRPDVRTPAVVAARITTPRPTPPPTAPAAAPDAAVRPTRRLRPTSPTTPAPTLAPSTPDTPVTASDAAQHTLPMVSSELLARAGKVARQYRTEHGMPITAGQLAVRLKVTSEQATQALAVLDLGPDSPTTPIPAVNGHRPKATR